MVAAENDLPVTNRDIPVLIRVGPYMYRYEYEYKHSHVCSSYMYLLHQACRQYSSTTGSYTGMHVFIEMKMME